ncbi:MAG: polyprenyl synthetase family protein [Phycisphaerales bacterium]
MGIGNPMTSATSTATGRLLDLALARVARIMSRAMGSSVQPVQELVTRAEGYRGKMIRPTLVLLSGLACGDPEELNLSRLGLTPTATPDLDDHPHDHHTQSDLTQPSPSARISERHLTIAAVIEMIHLATLVHDDVLDEADIRRGAPTIAKLRGNETAVMLGDFLISRSFELCASTGDASIAHRVGQISSRVCEGEIMQLSHRDDLALDETTYFDIIERKTACLIGLAAEMGARCSGASERIQSAAFEFAQQVGIAFQIQDDLLDLTGAERIVGKTLGKDLDKGKLTLPLIRHLAALDPADRARFTQDLARGAFLNGSRPTLIAALESTGAIQAARQAARDRIDAAKAALSHLPPTTARAELERIADAVITRDW